MRNLLDCCLGLGVLLLLGLGMAAAGLLRLPRGFGLLLVRLKAWGLGVLEGRVRINYRELWIGLTGAAGIGLIMLAGKPLEGSLVALAGQYFWVVDTWRARAWGKWAMSVFYTGVYIVGAARALWG